jgi:uncharacterized protein YfaS (alpha-2-macroglobulin family)
LTVGREYLPLGGGSEVHVGDLIQVRVTVMAPNDLHDLVVEDPLPAGLEPVDTRLKSTNQSLQPVQGPGWQPWSHVDVLADHVALFASYLRKGTYQYSYTARAAIAGKYQVFPTNGREQYFPEVFARTDGQRFTILP